MKSNKIKSILLITVIILSSMAFVSMLSATGTVVENYYPTLVESANADAEWVIWAADNRTGAALGTDGNAGFFQTWDALAKVSGDYGVILQSGAITGLSWVEIVPAAGITLGDLDSGVSGAWEYEYKTESANSPWVYFLLRFDDPAGADFVDIFDQEFAVDASSSFTTHDVDASSTYNYWGSQASSSFSGDAADLDLNGVYDEIVAATTGDVSGWTLTYVRVFLTDPQDLWVYVDDITVDGVLYDLEPDTFEGLYGAKLTLDAAATSSNYAYVRTYPNLDTQKTLTSLDLTKVSFDYYLDPAASGDHPDVELTFESASGSGWVELTVFPVWSTVPDRWHTEPRMATTDYCVAYGVNDDGDSIAISTGSNPYSNMKTVLEAAGYGAWELTIITPQLGWGHVGPIVAYIDNVKIDADVIELFEEETTLDYDNYKLDDTVVLSVFDIGRNTRPTIQDSGTFVAASDYPDQITVDLLETGIYSSVFEGSFTLVAATPGANDLLAADGSIVTTSYMDVRTVPTEHTTTLTVDGIAPAVTDWTPGEDANTSDVSPWIKAKVTDAGTIETAWMMLDGQLVDTTISADYLAYEVPALPVEVALAEGVHTVLVYSIDSAGNVNQTTWDFLVDSTDPVGVVSHNVTGIVSDATEIAYLFTFTEDMDVTVAPTVSGNATTNHGNEDEDWIDARTYSANYTVNDGFNGTVTIEMLGGKDMAGNDMVSANMTFYIDSLDPTAPANITKTAAATSVALDWDAATDLGSGMASYNIYEANVLLGSVASTVTAYTHTGLSATASLEYTVEAVDLAGNVQIGDNLTVAFVLGDVTEWEISLWEGWNLISVPLIPDDTAIAVVLADVLVNVTKVWSYNEATDTWLSYVPGGPPSLTTMVDGEGYWIEMSGNSTLTVHGVEMPAPPALPPTYDLVAGWNLIGYKALETMNATTYLGTSVAADTIRIYGYVDGSYFGVALSADLTPGLGYWIAMDEAGIVYP